MGVPPEFQIRCLKPQCPGISQRNLDAETDHPAGLRQAVAEGIVGVHSRRHVGAEIDVGYRIRDPGSRNPARGEYRRDADGLLDPGTRRGYPSKLRFHRLVQSLGIEPVRCRRQAAERAVQFDPERHATDLELPPDQRAADEPGTVVIDNRAGIAPVREAVDIDDPLQIVLVRDMWLTGFDAPSLHTMYVDKPMRGHGLMQAIARVNRVFRDKPGGLVVDYLGLAHELKRALATYTESGGTGKTALDQEEAVAVMLEKYEICCGLFHGFDRAKWTTGTPQERLGLLPTAQEHILAQENGKDRYVQSVRELSQAFALAVPHENAIRIRDDVAFFQAVQSVLAKRAPADARPEEELDHAVRQIISRAVASEGVIDIFAAAGLEKPDISILSEEFLAEVRGMPQRNLAVELLQKLLKGEVATRRRKNVVQARSFAQMLEQTLRLYQNRAIEAAQVIEELIQIARKLREAAVRGEKLGLSEDELAFYDALETNDSAVQVLGDETLRSIAQELVETVRGNVTIDWTLRENVRANLRRLVKRTLRRYGYPPDKQEKATRTVLEQAEVLSADWAT